MPRFGHVGGRASCPEVGESAQIPHIRGVRRLRGRPTCKQGKGVSMASSRLIVGRSRMAAAAVGSGFAVILGAWLWSFASPDRLLERSYARMAPQGTLFLDDAGADAASRLHVTQAKVLAETQVPTPALVVDGASVPSGILNEPLAVGDHVQFGHANTEMRTVEIQDVADMGAPVVGLPGVRLQLVTARTLDRRRSETLRLVFAVREASPVKVVPISAPASDKVL